MDLVSHFDILSHFHEFFQFVSQFQQKQFGSYQWLYLPYSLVSFWGTPYVTTPIHLSILCRLPPPLKIPYVFTPGLFPCGCISFKQFFFLQLKEQSLDCHPVISSQSQDNMEFDVTEDIICQLEDLWLDYSRQRDIPENISIDQFDGNDTKSSEDLEVENFQISRNLVSLQKLVFYLMFDYTNPLLSITVQWTILKEQFGSEHLFSKLPCTMSIGIRILQRADSTF